MKKIFSLLLCILVAVTMFTQSTYAKIPRINLIRNGDKLERASFVSIPRQFDASLLRNPLLYYKATISVKNNAETDNSKLNNVDNKDKETFRQLNKYVSHEEIASMDTLIKTVPLIGQFPSYPTGCESVAAVTLLNFYDDDITIDDFIDNYMELSNNFYYNDGKMFGPSPFDYFLGDPRNKSSWGCMSDVIEKAMAKRIGEDRVNNIKNATLDELCTEYIDKDTPVIVWVSIHMLDVFFTSSWYLEDGEQYFWPSNEHCMILIGYDEWYYYFSDPYIPAVVRYTKDIAEERYNTLGQQAITISEKKP